MQHFLPVECRDVFKKESIECGSIADEESQMTLRGHIRNGTLVFDEPPALPEGAAVEVELRAVSNGEPGQTLLERYRDIIGIAEGLPPDFSSNHDHYLYGTPIREERCAAE